MAKPGCKDIVKMDKKWYLRGEEITDSLELERLKNMRIPPSWNNVAVATDPLTKVQAIGLDKAGRWQYRYSMEHIKAAARKKFDRIKLFSKDMEKIRKGMERGIASGDPRAFLLRMEDTTGIRVGSLRDFKAKKKAYGLTTLKKEHVILKGDKVILDFVAKEGIPAHYEFTDKVLADWLRVRKRATSAGGYLFPDVPSGKLNAYLKNLAGGKNYTIKDFRTYHGTRIAFRELRKYAGKMLTGKAKRNLIQRVSVKVSSFLKNRPTMARKSYIDPMVWDFIGGL